MCGVRCSAPDAGNSSGRITALQIEDFISEETSNDDLFILGLAKIRNRTSSFSVNNHGLGTKTRFH